MSAEIVLRVALDAAYGEKPALRNVRFDLHSGEILGLVGSSGSGKSTLVHSLMGLLPWRGGSVRGEVLLNGENLLSISEKRWRELRGRKIGLIPQSPTASLNPAISLERHFREAWRAHATSQQDMDARVDVLLAKVQLPSDRDFLKRRANQISVGQAQRVLIALALLHNPELIIADEPTSSLDPVTQAQVVGLVRDVSQDMGATVLYISHDLVSVLQLADRVVVLDHGELVECLPVREIGCTRHAATRALLGALPVPPDVLLKFREPRDRNTNRQPA